MTDIRCLCCGQPVSDSDWCHETRDGYHRPHLGESA